MALRAVLVPGLLLALLAGLTACGGGMSRDEKKASANLAASFVGMRDCRTQGCEDRKPSKARVTVARCFADTVVKEAGLDRLRKDGVLNRDLEAAKTVPRRLSQKTAEAYGDAYVDCFDYRKLTRDIMKDTGASKAQVDAYVACVGRIDRDDLRQSIVDRYTKARATAVTKRIQAATTTCGKKLGT